MAYNKAFNPDALPAHAEPEQAAQALSQLDGNRRQQQSPPQTQANTGRRPSPAGIVPPPQSSYRPPPPQTYHQQRPSPNQSYGDGQYNRLTSGSPGTPSYNYGSRPPNDSFAGRRPSNEHGHPPPPPASRPLDPDSVDLVPLFRAANASGTGSLTTSELGSALYNADFTPFDGRTITSLMRMFTSSPPGHPQGPTITFVEFESLWAFLAKWRELFERFDSDRSGRVSLAEFSTAMKEFGYRLSQPFVGVLYNTFNDRSPTQGQGMNFDLFVQACISLKRMTDVFKKYDDDRDGYVTLSFEEFLTEILRLRD
ncbi:hypothetical protein B0A52_09964 [Exophiala mesophila]|uniref:EF-hand domain-containing protein n=1 Tax=Exophiala mesophila TaxID=212818 RepID=A0A438MRU3_EXOME|nr:hypothetical protein B0A52_09964 [Exophiala mesophila]